MSGQQLLAKNPNKQALASQIKADVLRLPTTPQQLTELFNYLLNPTTPIDVVELDWLRCLVAGGSSFEEFSKLAKQYDNAVVCGLVWTADFVAYRCRTCSISPCMSLCSDCFHAGNHTGHDYNMFRSQAGGACDCGDMGVMQETGFCPVHGPEHARKRPCAPNELTVVAVTMMPQLILRLVYHLRDNWASERLDTLATAITDTDQYLGLLHQLSDMGTAMRQVFTLTLSSTKIYSNLTGEAAESRSGYCAQSQQNYLTAKDSLLAPCLPAVFEGLELDQEPLVHTTLLDELIFWVLKYEFPQKLVTLLLSILPNDEYKEAFTRSFVKHYSRIAVSLVKAEDRQQISNRVVHISVQLLSPEGLACRMCTQYKLLYSVLASLWYMLHTILTHTEEMDDFHPVVDCTRMILKEHCYWPIVSDLINVLSHRPIAMQFINDPQLLSFWLNIVSYFQGMNVNQRELIQHVEYEPESYYAAFSAELEMCASPLWALMQHLKSEEECDLSVTVVRAVLLELEKWFSAINFDPYSRANRLHVSFHLPLHRYLAIFLSNAVRKQKMALADLLPKNEVLQMLMIHPLHLQVVFTEIFCGMWVRNGLQIKGQALTYIQCHFCNSMVDPDIYLLQVCATQLDSDYYVRTMLDRFHVLDLLTFAPIDDKRRLPFFEPSHWMGMVEGALSTLTMVICLRNNIDLTEDKVTLSDMVALLCMSDRTHSQLSDLMPERCGLGHNKKFEQILSAASEYKAPNFEMGGGMQQGMYMPTGAVWLTQYDPLYVMLRAMHKKDYQSSLDRFTEFLKQHPEHREVSNPWPPFRLPSPPPPQYAGLTSLLHCRTLHGVLLVLLFKVVNDKNVPDSVLYLVIHLLHLSVVTPKSGFPDRSTVSSVGSRFDKQFGKWFPTSNVFTNLHTIVPEVMVTMYGPPDSDPLDTAAPSSTEHSSPDLNFHMAPSALSVSSGFLTTSGQTPMMTNPSTEVASLVQNMLNQAVTNAAAGGGITMTTTATGTITDPASEHDSPLSSSSTSTSEHRVKSQGVSANLDRVKHIVPVPVNESILSLLLKLHDRLSGKECSFIPQDGTTAQPQHCIGDGAYHVAKLLQVISDRDAECHSIIVEAQACNLKHPPTLKKSISMEEKKRRAKDRQQKMMSKIAQQQREFAEKVILDSPELAPEEEMDAGDSSPQQHPPSRVLSERQYDCVICNQTAPSTEERPLGLVTLLQPTSVLGLRQRCEEAPPLPVSNSTPLYAPTNMAVDFRKRLQALNQYFNPTSVQMSVNESWQSAVSAQTCGHHVHFHCLTSYIDSLRMQQSQSLMVHQGEYWCPMCRQLANSVLPLQPEDEAMLSRGMAASPQEMASRVWEDLHRRTYSLGATPLHQALAHVKKDLFHPEYLEHIDLSRWRDVLAVGNLNLMYMCSVLRTNLELSVLQRGGSPCIPLASPLAARKSCLGVLQRVVSFYGKLTEPKAGVEIWTSVSGYCRPANAETSIVLQHREVPILLRDPSSLLLLLVGSLPHHMEKEVFQCMVRVVYNLLFVQAAAAVSCKFAEDERAAWRAKSKERSAMSLSGWLHLVIDALSGSALYDDDHDADPHVPAICQSVWSPQSVEADIQCHCLPTLRLAAMLQHHMYSDVLPTLTHTALGSVEEYSSLCHYLGLMERATDMACGASPEPMQCGSGVVSSVDSLHWYSTAGPELLVQAWCREFTTFVNKEASASRMLLMTTPMWHAPQLFALPQLYERVFQFYRKQCCQTCHQTPQDPTICLVCARLVCFKQACCRDEHQAFECVSHARLCGGGTGIYLIVNSSLIIVVRGQRAAVWGSVYLDEHGEEDKDLRRGKPLYLSMDRYRVLHKQWLTHSFDHACKRWVFHNNKL